MRNMIMGVLGGCLFAMSPLGFSSESMEDQDVELTDITHGNCSMQFPGAPQRVSEKMQLEGEGFDLQYDAYVSSSSDDKTIYMLLVAQYPDYVDENFARMSLEAFLNGILTHNAENQLLSADLVLVQGHEGLDFFIRSGGIYFKGVAVMIRNQLYVMAMECEVQNYDEASYTAFVKSFSLES